MVVATMCQSPVIQYTDVIKSETSEKNYGALYKRKNLSSDQLEISCVLTNKMEDKGNNMYYEFSIPSGVKVMNGTVKLYFIEMAKNDDFVNINNKIIGGVPAVSGHRIPVSLIVACIRDGMTIDEIADDYKIPSNVIEGVLNYVVNILDKPYEGDEA